jgi:hypothetical protein
MKFAQRAFLSDYTHLLYYAKTCIAWRPGELTQFFVNHRQELLSGVGIALVDGRQDPRHVAQGQHFGTWSGWPEYNAEAIFR